MHHRRGEFLLGFFLFLAMFLIPFVAFGNPAAGKAGSSKSESPASSHPQETGSSFHILDTATKQILTVGDREFMTGAVAAEMSPSAEQEALKAQAVACYTYYCRLRENQKKTPDSSLNGADFSADLQNGQIYLTDELRKKRWGTHYDEYAQALKTAIDPVFGLVLKSGGELIEATYYAISSGNTESSADVWGGERPYLISVASPGDRFAGGYQTTVTLSLEKMKACILSAAPDADLSGDPSGWAGTAERTAAGSVKTILLGGKSVTGNNARAAFGLRSANFTVSYSNGQFTFSVLGYGHDVGMSQAGAQYMAKQGADYRQILSWYYPTTTLAA
ncbi:stage II sporulation protein D [Caproicibacter fermentans]|uniref:Stage II sporulation protein D n=1 Tax=Caproicibacter fermentans TaxID=2576756 RepID=A0A7G8TE79_9FIRM|nr:stage II sporulation protein D [Caproicibacter fermentans]QNK41920.1 stage II sporulation protein D [Caproicibacter fermentans]